MICIHVRSDFFGLTGGCIKVNRNSGVWTYVICGRVDDMNAMGICQSSEREYLHIHV